MTCHHQLPAGLLPLPPPGRDQTFMTTSCSQDTVLVYAFHLDLSHIWLLFIHMTWLFVRIIFVHIHQRLLRTRRRQRNQEQWLDRAWIDLIIWVEQGCSKFIPPVFQINEIWTVLEGNTLMAWSDNSLKPQSDIPPTPTLAHLSDWTGWPMTAKHIQSLGPSCCFSSWEKSKPFEWAKQPACLQHDH